MNNNNNNNNNVKENNNVYIMSLEASNIYTHLNRNDKLNTNYVGMIPYSLELLKLQKENIKIKQDKITNKKTSDDIINVKFDYEVKDSVYLSEKTKEKLAKINKEIEDLESSKSNNIKLEKLKNYARKLEEYIEYLKDTDYKKVSQDKLREELYNNGFVLQIGKRKVKYVVYKRSSAKSRVGQCLFIKENLYKKMIKWSRMGINFKNKEIDYPSLLSYESLVTSAIEDTINIDVDKILIVDDVFSRFTRTCNVVKKDIDGNLDSFVEDVEVENNIFDGESVLDSRYFEDGKGMKLLRNHFFKSCSFNCNLQQFLKDNCPKDVKYDDWYITNMFGEKIKASNVDMIITPSSLKALKFSKLVGTKKDMFNYWKNIVKQDGNIFGVCKSEKKSKRGEIDGKILQQLSYQMFNSLDFSKKDIKDIITIEKNYINKLKNDDNCFIEYLKNTANTTNCNEMLIDLYNVNSNIANTEMFRTFRAKQIHNYVNYIKQGKVRTVGDYGVLAGNILELLYHSIGIDVLSKEYKENMKLKGNQVYTKLFDDGEELAMFRNPHTSQSNCLYGINKHVDEIDKYFNFTDNITCVNAIDFQIQDILSSADYDSDTVLNSNNKTLVKLCKHNFENYRTVINGVEADKKLYKVNNYSMYLIDSQLSQSQFLIGEIVNLGQWCLSKYWEQKRKDSDEDIAENLLKAVDIMTVLSCIAIDLAKKMYMIDFEKTIKDVKVKAKLIKKAKPIFFRYICEKCNNYKYYNTPMDDLQIEMNNIKVADYKNNVDFKNLLRIKSAKNADRKQKADIIKRVREYNNKELEIKIKYKKIKKKKEEKEKKTLLDNNIKYCTYFLEKKKINEVTMYSILKDLNKYSIIEISLLNMLYKTHKEVFLNAFKEDIKKIRKIV